MLFLFGLIFLQALELNKETLQQIEKCRNGDAKLCYKAGLFLSTGRNEQDQEKKDLGLEYIRRACSYGVKKACDTMGDNYFKDKHYLAAKPYLEKSCKRDIVFACNALGTMYRDGHDVRQNDVKSRHYYEKACLLKEPNACINVAIMYRGGFGVEKNQTAEKKYYKMACEAGSKAGCKSFKYIDDEEKGINTSSIIYRLKSLFN